MAIHGYPWLTQTAQQCSALRCKQRPHGRVILRFRRTCFLMEWRYAEEKGFGQQGSPHFRAISGQFQGESVNMVRNWYKLLINWYKLPSHEIWAITVYKRYTKTRRFSPHFKGQLVRPGTNARADVWGHATKGHRYSITGPLESLAAFRWWSLGFFQRIGSTEDQQQPTATLRKGYITQLAPAKKNLLFSRCLAIRQLSHFKKNLQHVLFLPTTCVYQWLDT